VPNWLVSSVSKSSLREFKSPKKGKDHDIRQLASGKRPLPISVFQSEPPIEGKMLRGPVAFVFLQYDHASVTTRAKKEPISPGIAQSLFKAEHVLVESFGPGKLLYANGHFVNATYW
jgi:hypothetical protein